MKEGRKTKEPETQNSVKTPQLLNSQMLPPCDSFNFRNILSCWQLTACKQISGLISFIHKHSKTIIFRLNIKLGFEYTVLRTETEASSGHIQGKVLTLQLTSCVPMKNCSGHNSTTGADSFDPALHKKHSAMWLKHHTGFVCDSWESGLRGRAYLVRPDADTQLWELCWQMCRCRADLPVQTLTQGLLLCSALQDRQAV